MPNYENEPLLRENNDRFTMFPIKCVPRSPRVARATPPLAARDTAAAASLPPRCVAARVARAAAGVTSSGVTRFDVIFRLAAGAARRYPDIWEQYKRAEASFWTGAPRPPPRRSAAPVCEK